MAKINDILNARMEVETVPQAVIDAVDTTPGLTDERYQNNVLATLGQDVPWWMTNEGIAESSRPIDPTLAYFMGRLKLTNDDPKKEGAKTAVEKLIDNYKRDWKEWKKTIVDDPNLGTKGWKTFQDLWKRAVYDQAEEKTKKARYDAVHDGTLSGFLTRMAFPRSTERIAATGDFEPKDMALDLGENGLMMVPGTSYAKLGSKLLPSRVLGAGRGLVNYLKGSNSPLLTGAGYALGSVPNVLGNTVVPLVSEIADDIAYDPGEGMDNRANFSIGDVALGGAINQAVNRGLIRAIAPYIDKYSGEVKSVGARKLRNFFETLGKSKTELGNDFVTETRRTINSPVVRTFEEGTKVTPGELAAIKEGYNIIPEGVGVEDYINADLVNRVIGLIDNGEISMKTGEAIAKEVAKSNKRAAKEISKLAEESATEATHAANAGRMSDAAAYQAEKDALDNLVEGRNLGGLRPQQIIENMHLAGDAPASRAVSPQGVATVFNEHPELYNYAFWKNAPFLDKVGNALNQAVPSVIINKAGKSSYAPEMTQVFKSEIEDNRKESAKQAKKASVSKVLEAGSKSGTLTDEDKKWLAVVADNPNVLVNGLNSGNAKADDDFKMWLITGGNDLLRGTEAHRPIWAIE